MSYSPSLDDSTNATTCSGDSEVRASTPPVLAAFPVTPATPVRTPKADCTVFGTPAPTTDEASEFTVPSAERQRDFSDDQDDVEMLDGQEMMSIGDPPVFSRAIGSIPPTFTFLCAFNNAMEHCTDGITPDWLNNNTEAYYRHLKVPSPEFR